MKNLPTIASGVLLAATLVPACAESPSIEDGEGDNFATADDKADAFGVEDWSPDGAAVIKYVNRASKNDLIDDVGLSARVATNIINGRRAGEYKDLVELDRVPYVGKTVYTALAAYALEAKLYKTSIRIPLLINTGTDRHGNDIVKPLSSFNSQMVAAGLKPFGRFIYVDSDTDKYEKMQGYSDRIEEMNTKLGLDLPDTMVFTGYGYNSFEVGSYPPCYVGNVEEVEGVAESGADSLVSDQYSVYAWRYGKKKFFQNVEEDEVDEREFGSAWTRFDTKSSAVAIEYSIGDDGTDVNIDLIKACR